MNAWGLLYESIQSALIDALNNRYPSATPELGLPFAQPQWEAPALRSAEVHESWNAGISLEEPAGHGMLCLLSHGTLSRELWSDFLKLSALEFKSRTERTHGSAGMRLALGESSHSNGAPDWNLFGRPSRVVWTPLRLQTTESASALFLGMGIIRKT